MHRSTRSFAPGISSRALFLAVAALWIAVPAWADVTIKEKTVTSGLMGFGNGTSERTVVIAGDKSRSDESHTYTGHLQSLAGGPQATVQITRLDRELLWQLDPKKQEYTEMTFADMRAAMDQAMEEAQKAKAKEQGAGANLQFSVDVQRTGKKDTVNGFVAEEALITVTASTTAKGQGDAAGGPPATVYTMKMDEWLAADVPGSSEAQDFYRDFAQKLGIDPQVQAMAQGMMAQYGDALKQMAEKMRELKGYPVRTTVSVILGAEMTPEQQAQMEKSRADADKARADQQQAEQKQQDEAANQSAAGSLAHGNLGGALGGLLGHKASKAAQSSAGTSSGSSGSAPSGAPGGMTITTDVVSITAGASGANFDVPADYKKVAGRSSRH